MTDSELLARSVAGSEDAFAQLVRRHAGLVYGCCLRTLGNAEDAEDAAQATFLVLHRKLRELPAQVVLAGWLYRTAGLAARDHRKLKARRERHEREAAQMMAQTLQTPDATWTALQPQLDAALAALPAAQREAVVLRYLDGRSRADAAREARCPEKTLASRLSLALEKLRARLSRKGVQLSALTLAGCLAERAANAAPENVISSIQAACLGKAGASVLAAQTAEEVLKAMFWMKLKLCAATVALVTLLVLSGVIGIMSLPAQENAAPAAPQPAPKADRGAGVPAGQPSAASSYSAEADALRSRFARYYAPVPVKAEPRAPQYALPLELEKLSNADVAQKRIVNAALRGLLVKNGFAAEPPSRWSDDVGEFYKGLKLAGTPVFVTSDSLLHLYHIQFDETLKDVEEREFFKDALALSKALYDASIKQAQASSGIVQEAARLNAGYFAVALECLAADRTHDELVRARAALATADKYGGGHVLAQEFPTLVEALLALEPAKPSPDQAARPARSPQGAELPYQTADCLKLVDAALQKYPAGKKDVAYTLGDGLPAAQADELRKSVAAELALIAKHEGFAESPLFQYREDYSQYVPRGHYTRSEKLQRYFKALMWLGRMTALVKGGEPHGPAAPYLVSAEVARVQTTAGVLAAQLLDTVKADEQRSAREVWERLYSVTAFYVGFADDLTPFEYRNAANKILGERFKPEALADEGQYKALRLELAKLRGPAIYSGTGDIEGPPAAGVAEDELLKALERTKGFRLMGQRYIPDSYMLGKLVYPTVGPWGGGEFAFTTVSSAGGQLRGFPRGLDVMAVLGSVRAREITKTLRDDNYIKAGGARSYDEALGDLRKEFAALDETHWNQNLYWSWLYCLKALLQDSGAGYPTFMQTVAWKDKQLNAALGSWSQLRHDTILYAKQSGTMRGGGRPPQPKMVEGYVEPVVEFYARLLALTRMTRKGLDEMKVLSPEATKRLDELERIVVRLLEISVKELAGEFLNQDDYDFIRNFGEQLSGVVAGVKKDGLQTTIVADVHTDGNTQQVLEEGTGKLRALWAVYPMPDGGLVLGCGPAFSYYEFKHPMSDRLTDEKWRTLLQGKQAPALPEWTSSYGVNAAEK